MNHYDTLLQSLNTHYESALKCCEQYMITSDVGFINTYNTEIQVAKNAKILLEQLAYYPQLEGGRWV